MRKLATLVIGAILCGGALLAGDLSGIWVGQISGRNNEMQDIAFKLTQNGTALSGKLYGENESAPIIEGKITGEELMFIIIAREQAGNQISDTRLRFTGTFKDGEIELTRERVGSTNAGNGGTFTPRNSGKQTFKLKRIGSV